MKKLLGEVKGVFCIVAPFWCDYRYNEEWSCFIGVVLRMPFINIVKAGRNASRLPRRHWHWQAEYLLYNSRACARESGLVSNQHLSAREELRGSTQVESPSAGTTKMYEVVLLRYAAAMAWPPPYTGQKAFPRLCRRRGSYAPAEAVKLNERTERLVHGVAAQALERQRRMLWSILDERKRVKAVKWANGEHRYIRRSARSFNRLRVMTKSKKALEKISGKIL